MYQPIDAGTLDKRVTIQRLTETDDAAGGAGLTTAWTDAGTWSVGIDTTGGREFRAAQQLQPELTHEIKGRFRTDVSTKNRLAFVGKSILRSFVIHAVINPMQRNEQLVCFCSEIAPV